MAEALSVFGAVAAASQTAQQCIVIVKMMYSLYSKIHAAPNSIRSQIGLVEQFITITRMIEPNKSLQTDTMASLLETCLETTRQLLDELSRISTSARDGKVRRFWKGLVSLVVEEKLQGLFAQLEQRKSSLLLCIGTIDAGLLQSTQSQLSVIDVKVTTLCEELLPASRALQTSQQIPTASTERSPCFSLPFGRDRQFVGREDILMDIDRRFQRPGYIVLAGIGGVGKSQVAIEYSYRFRGQHPDAHVFWIHSSNMTTIRKAYKDIARQLGLPGWDDPKVNILQLVSGWLSSHMREPWLLIYDSADDKKLFLPDPLLLGDERTSPLLYYLPQAPNGSILITTRDKRLAVDISCDDGLIEILPMTKSEANKLLSKRLIPENSGLINLNSDKLCKALEYLPLAITQAAAFISKNRITVDKYLEVFHTSDSGMQNLLSKETLDRRRNLPDFGVPDSVIRAWKVTFDQIIKQDFRASEILSLMAVLDGQRVPEMLLFQFDTDNPDFIEAVGTLKAFSFIYEEIGAATFIIHRLVQVSTRKWLAIRGDIAKWQEMALNAVTTSFPFDSDDIEKSKTCDVLLPHVQVVRQYTYVSNECLLKKAEILHKASSYNYVAGRWDDARPMALEAYDIRRRIMGSENPLTLTVMYMVARCLFVQSKFEDADGMFQQHFNLAKRILGSEHRETLRSMASVAMIKFHYKGQFSEGEGSYRNILELRERALGLDHPDTLTCMANLGQMMRRQGKHEAAVEMHRKALMHRKKLLGDQHPDTLVSLDYLSEALTATGDHKTAEEMCQTALQLQESRLGPRHPKTFQIMGTLAKVLSGQMRYEESEKMYRQVLTIRQEVLGIDHRDTIMNSVLLGGVLESQGMYGQAEELYRESLPGYKITLGSEHPDTIICLRRLADVLCTQGKPDAEAVTWELLELQEKTMKIPDESIMLTTHTVAMQLEKRQDYSGAETMFRRLMELRKQVFGMESIEVIKAMRALMFNLGNQGRPEEALEVCRSLGELQIKVFGNEHPETIMTVNNTASWLDVLGRREECEAERHKSLALQEKILDDNHPHSITELNRSAQSLENQGKTQEAIKTYQEALRLQVQVLGFNHAKTVSTILEVQQILGYTGSEPDLPHGQWPRIQWLLAPERVMGFTRRVSDAV